MERLTKTVFPMISFFHTVLDEIEECGAREEEVEASTEEAAAEWAPLCEGKDFISNMRLSARF